MKTAGRFSVLAAETVAALGLLAVLTPSASAQIIGGYRRTSDDMKTTTPAQAAPTQTAPTQSMPSRPEPVRSGFGLTRPFGNMPAFSITTNNSVYSSQRPTRFGAGPSAIVPDYSDRNRYYHNSWPQPSLPVGTSNVFTNNSLPPIGPANGFFQRPIPPIGPANGFFQHPIPPVGPANGFFNSRDNRPTGPIYSNVPLLGGYNYGNYCNDPVPSQTYPSVYSTYSGFPSYLYNPAVVVISQPYIPVYDTAYLPFYTPSYPAVYNQNNYYVTNEDRAQDLEAGGDRAKEALRHAYPSDSYQAAFGDIALAWMDGTIKPIRRHIHTSDTRISVFLDKKYAYSIASDDFVQITRDALDRLNTVSFDFTRLRKAKNGDVTAYGTHVYRVEAADNADTAKDGDTVPFDLNGSGKDVASVYDKTNDPSAGEEKTVYVSYTLHRQETQWDIISVDTADQPLVAAQ